MRIRIPAGSYAAMATSIEAAWIRVGALLAGAFVALAVIGSAKLVLGELDGMAMISIAFIALPVAFGVVGGLFKSPESREFFLPFWLGNLLACGLVSLIGGYHIGEMSPLTFSFAGLGIFLALNLPVWVAVRAVATKVRDSRRQRRTYRVLRRT